MNHEHVSFYIVNSELINLQVGGLFKYLLTMLHKRRHSEEDRFSYLDFRVNRYTCYKTLLKLKRRTGRNTRFTRLDTLLTKQFWATEFYSNFIKSVCNLISVIKRSAQPLLNT